jgi:hypothetical protein
MPFPFAFAWLNAIRAVRHSHIGYVQVKIGTVQDDFWTVQVKIRTVQDADLTKSDEILG